VSSSPILGTLNQRLQFEAQGQLDASGNLPVTTLAAPPGRFSVKLVVAEKDSAPFLAAGARGAAAIYTEHHQRESP
jgi:hypothetical protein